ncbi:CdaR family transcriptional regulator [Peribacillus sp. SCS-155]|uniref:CdaR family transcriptional regulator n=1 Tax=Peribacillus sedimenti TaxID=3115297 RepID=UPI003906CBBF
MNILEHIAQDITEKTSEVLKYPISITDNEGFIIGCTDKDRIGIFHKPSLEVIKKDRMVDCQEKIENRILPGVSVPLKFNNEVIGVLGIIGDPREVEKYVQLVKNQVEMMCQDAFRKEVLELQAKMVELFVHRVIHYNDTEDNDHIIKYADMLHYDLQKDRTCLLIDIYSPSQKPKNDIRNETLFNGAQLQYFQKEILDFLHLLFHETKDDIISSINIERFVIFKSIMKNQSFSQLQENLERKLQRLNTFLESKYSVSACMAAGDVSSGIGGFSESYNHAKKAMKIGKSTEPEPCIYFYNERETLLRLLPKELSKDLQHKLIQLITPLIQQDNYDILAQTFNMFCKHNMNLSVASRNMYIHRNTIIYRLERIKELTSLDTSQFEQCMLLYTAIQIYEESRTKEKSPVT